MMSQDSIKKYLPFFAGLACSLGIGFAHAETRSFTANIRFVAPLVMTDVSDPDFGTFESGGSGRNFILRTDGTITGANANAYVGGAKAGSVMIHGSAAQRIDIVAQNPVANGGVAIANVICNYGGSGDRNCASGITAGAQPTPTGTPLLIGMDINTTTAHTDGQYAAPTFDIVVTYN